MIGKVKSRCSPDIDLPNFGLGFQVRIKLKRSTKKLIPSASAHQNRTAGNNGQYHTVRKMSLVIFVYLSDRKTSEPIIFKSISSWVFCLGAKKWRARFPPISRICKTLAVTISAKKTLYTPASKSELPPSVVEVYGVMRRMNTTAFIQRKIAILMYNQTSLL